MNSHRSTKKSQNFERGKFERVTSEQSEIPTVVKLQRISSPTSSNYTHSKIQAKHGRRVKSSGTNAKRVNGNNTINIIVGKQRKQIVDNAKLMSIASDLRKNILPRQH